MAHNQRELDEEMGKNGSRDQKGLLGKRVQGLVSVVAVKGKKKKGGRLKRASRNWGPVSAEGGI